MRFIFILAFKLNQQLNNTLIPHVCVFQLRLYQQQIVLNVAVDGGSGGGGSGGTTSGGGGSGGTISGGGGSGGGTSGGGGSDGDTSGSGGSYMPNSNDGGTGFDSQALESKSIFLDIVFRPVTFGLISNYLFIYRKI